MTKILSRKRYLINVLNAVCFKINNYWVKNYHKRIERNGYHELVNLADKYAKELQNIWEQENHTKLN